MGRPKSNNVQINISIPISTTATVINWVKLELGNIATKYTPKSFSDEYIICQRYYTVTPINSYGGIAIVTESYRNRALEPVKIPIPMRTTPSMRVFSVTTGSYNVEGQIEIVGSTSSVSGCTVRAYGTEYFIVSGTGITVGTRYVYGYSADASIYP